MEVGDIEVSHIVTDWNLYLLLQLLAKNGSAHVGQTDRILILSNVKLTNKYIKVHFLPFAECTPYANPPSSRLLNVSHNAAICAVMRVFSCS